MGTTPNFGWPVPEATDLVKDGWEAIADLGDAIDATVAGLGSGLVLVKSQTIGSGVSSVAVTNAFSATYDAYKIVVTNGASSTDTQFQMQMGATTTGYYETRNGSGFAASGTPHFFGSSNASKWTDVGVARTVGLDIDLDIRSPYLSKQTNFVASRVDSGNCYFVAGYLNNTSSYTGFTLNPISGTLTGGEIRVYGYALS